MARFVVPEPADHSRYDPGGLPSPLDAPCRRSIEFRNCLFPRLLSRYWALGALGNHSKRLAFFLVRSLH